MFQDDVKRSLYHKNSFTRMHTHDSQIKHTLLKKQFIYAENAKPSQLCKGMNKVSKHFTFGDLILKGYGCIQYTLFQ